MFFFPFATDAPIYHWPIITVLMIVLNAVIFIATGDSDSAWFPILLYDEINPLAWVTSSFRHLDILHLVGNALFLWPFGLVVEGKLGWYRFLAVYLGIGIVECALEQILMYSLSVPGGSLGASAILFGLMGLALVWAPKNDLKVFYVFFMGYFARAGVWDMSILTFSGVYLAWQGVAFALSGFDVSGALLHLVGFAVGFPLGIAMLKLRWVDCEGWDLLAVWSGKLPTSIDATEQRANDEATNQKFQEKAEEQLQESRTAAVDLIQHHLAEGRAAIAYAVYAKHGGLSDHAWQLPEPQMAALANAVVTEKMWPEAIILLRRIISGYQEHASAARLKLAYILIQIEHRPKQALAVLGKLPLALTDPMSKRRDQLSQLAQQEIDEGALEMAIEDW